MIVVCVHTVSLLSSKKIKKTLIPNHNRYMTLFEYYPFDRDPSRILLHTREKKNKYKEQLILKFTLSKC